MIRIKYVHNGLIGAENHKLPDIQIDDCLFIQDAACREYDWLVMYDDFPRCSIGSIVKEREELACPAGQTIFVTAEPPTIKIYPQVFTRQFGYVLTTHKPCYLPHRNHRIGQGCLHWQSGHSREEVLRMPDYPKTKLFGTVCSTKQQTHTMHQARYNLTSYVSQHMPEMDWYGWGVKRLEYKYDALNDYRYHLAVENYIEDYHWTDKISDPILGLCLTFYAGDPKLGEVLPPESFIPIPVDDHEKALSIIQEAIRNNEYEKRLPAIREARRLIVTKYNMFNQVVDLIHAHRAEHGDTPQTYPRKNLQGRHRLRKNPLCLLSEGLELLRHKLAFKFSKKKH